MNGLIWVDVFLAFMITMLISVPRGAIKKHITVALVGGFGQSIFITGLLVAVLGYWKFNYTDIFSLDGVPVFASMAWAPVLVIYSFYLSRLTKRSEIYAYVIAFSLATGLFVHWLLKAGLLVFLYWNDLFTVIMALVLFSPVTYFLVRHRPELKYLRHDD